MLEHTILHVVPVRILLVGRSITAVLFLVVFLVAILVVVRGPICRSRKRTEETLIIQPKDFQILKGHPCVFLAPRLIGWTEGVRCCEFSLG